MPTKPSKKSKDAAIAADPASAFRRFESAMRKIVQVPKKELDEQIMAKRRRRPSPRHPAK